MFGHWLIFTDMDGTLLNHHDYDYAAAVPLLASLQQQNIPVILNTSKTFAELEQWVATLRLKHPFIVENGSAIFIPLDYFAPDMVERHLPEATVHRGYLLKTIGQPLNVLNDYVQAVEPQAINFTTCSLEQAMDITGLAENEARQAQTRQFSVPLYFEDRQAEKTFVSKAEKDGYNCLRGGRFVHLQGHCDKGHSMLLLKQLYQAQAPLDYGLIALGDSPNDLAMLEQADIAVVVKSPGSARIKLEHRESVILTTQGAPEGWVEGVTRALNQKL